MTGRIYYKAIETPEQVEKQEWNTWILLGVDGNIIIIIYLFLT